MSMQRSVTGRAGDCVRYYASEADCTIAAALVRKERNNVRACRMFAK